MRVRRDTEVRICSPTGPVELCRHWWTKIAVDHSARCNYLLYDSLGEQHFRHSEYFLFDRGWFLIFLHHLLNSVENLNAHAGVNIENCPNVLDWRLGCIVVSLRCSDLDCWSIGTSIQLITQVDGYYIVFTFYLCALHCISDGAVVRIIQRAAYASHLFEHIYNNTIRPNLRDG